MCGIIGKIAFSKSILPLPQIDLIRHRGPDGKGEWINCEGNIYFGHTRLAILEPTQAGYQPMQSSSKRFTIIFNGEIYNHLNLRSLIPFNSWHGTSDTETLIELLEFMGTKALSLLKGMFAFALHDSVDNSVLLVRDRLGIKPLWVRFDAAACTFASEIKPLLNPDDKLPSSQAISEFVAFGRMTGVDEIFSGVNAVSPGSLIKLNNKGEIKTENWWTPESAPLAKLIPYNQNYYVQKVNKLVKSSVTEHLISDVGVGAFLSGGIDSSIIVLVAGKELGKNLKTFTVGFHEKAFDERKVARKVAQKAGSEHFEIEVSEESCVSWVKEAVYNLDLPSVDAINTYIVSKVVREQGMKVALSGLGGDELFGGYPSFKNVPLLTWLSALPKRYSEQLVKLMPKQLKQKLSGLNGFSAAELTVSRRRFTSVSELCKMGLSTGHSYVPPPPEGVDKMAIISWAEIYGYMIPLLLRDSDQMSMALGLEIRVPFLDHHLVEEVLKIPQSYKKGYGVKPLLIDAFRSDLPREVYNRPKQGFVLPMENWMRGHLAEFTEEGIYAAADLLGLSEPLRQREIFMKGQSHWTRLWLWSVLGHWLLNHKAIPVETSTSNIGIS
ncbi:asparagine synthase (glutamine-hydrolysing) [Pontibacter ramchanderi]|uniref:asparagine synthase (glutamine-hydrolyzing) n=2 Tax=Pontibacter ramchanderi TaxID=1179743 RepID=A0A2N3V1M5_9BACT|nr:asparagine synthase (glutamine-hydrolysing) [Pontibacter ramchanderi]